MSRKKRAKKVGRAQNTLNEQEQIAALVVSITAERQAASTQLSTQSRAIALGVLAVVWLLLNGSQDTLSKRFATFADPLLWIAATCVIALVADFLQYAFALRETDLALDDTENATKLEEAGYDDPSWLRRLNVASFVLKLVASCVAAGWLLFVMFKALTAAT